MKIFKKITLLTLIIVMCTTTATYAYPSIQENITLNPCHFNDENHDIFEDR